MSDLYSTLLRYVLPVLVGALIAELGHLGRDWWHRPVEDRRTRATEQTADAAERTSYAQIVTALQLALDAERANSAGYRDAWNAERHEKEQWQERAERALGATRSAVAHVEQTLTQPLAAPVTDAQPTP